MNRENDIALTPEAMQLITGEQAWHYRVIPKDHDNGTLVFYIDETEEISRTAEELEALLSKPVVLKPAPSELIAKTLGKYYRRGSPDKRRINISGDIDFLIKLISEAHELKSSDIHIEAFENGGRVRMRLDGRLMERYVIAKDQYPPLINKIKIRSGLDISEKRLPQDGRIFFDIDGTRFDIRVSVLPTLHGEKAVLRLLSRDATSIDISSLGFSPSDLEKYMEGIRRPNGITLISGPTGSGKTTTLYATLKLLNSETGNILTIEDPIEYTLEGINQVQLRENIGLTFAKALRTFLRQDPDIIMVGEIRDTETATMAIRAALTGHLVLSTIHTNSAWGTVARLIDMGTPPYLLASTLNISVAQRLVRLLCNRCKQKEKFDERLYPKGFKPFGKVEYHFISAGCDDCHYTGYSGRTAVYEIIPVNDEFAQCIRSQQMQIGDLMNQRGIRTLACNGFDLFGRGLTSMEEVYPLLHSE